MNSEVRTARKEGMMARVSHTVPHQGARRPNSPAFSAVPFVLGLVCVAGCDRRPAVPTELPDEPWGLALDEAYPSHVPMDRPPLAVAEVIAGNLMVLETGDRVSLAGVACGIPGGQDQNRELAAKHGVDLATVVRYAEVARDALRRQLTGEAASTVKIDSCGLPSHGAEIVAYVWVVHTGDMHECLNESLLLNGLAFPDHELEHPMKEKYKYLAIYARSQGVGLWAGPHPGRGRPVGTQASSGGRRELSTAHAAEANSLADRATACWKRGEFGRAVELFGKAIDVTPDDPQLYVGRGLVYERKGELKKALADYDKAIELDRDNALALECRASVYVSLGDKGAAAADTRSIREPSAEDATGWLTRGIRLKQADDLEGAESCFKRAAEINPRLADPHYFLGSLYMLGLQNEDLARASFQRAVELDGEGETGRQAKSMLDIIGGPKIREGPADPDDPGPDGSHR